MITEIKTTQAVAIQPEPRTRNSLDGCVVAGYTLQERLGIGGYGEVWRAVGPGGLHKALKILHGFQDGPQAELELKSLERMRDLRHPFLLNIERIEVDNGRLVIVTELAEGSLEDRFEQLCREGRPGIPRDELLAYLRDGADALDFMYEQHGLQHLDIKPGNLLLQAGRVKVADFGLTKDVRQTQVSIVGGFTPRFAPPELFEGRPSRSSDQYSLGIVYQLLVTGTAPFAGRTTAQLAAQHLSCPPDLSPLNPADRPTVGRALSKNPHARFASCRAFVDRLSERSTPQPGQRHFAARTAGNEELLDQRPGENGSRPPRRSIPLGSLPLEGGPARYRPTLVVGIGGLGGAVLRSLRRRLQSCFGRVPAVQFLYLDTDFRSIAASTEDEGLRKEEVECIELRRADEYRRSSRSLLEWLSRRWLFNIPRSGQVQGMRPLGRLALVDHQERVRTLLRQSLRQATSTEALAASTAASGLPFEPLPPEVIVVSSVCGGTGGGAVLDAAYMLRQQLVELDLEGGNLLGVLLHATSADAQSGKVQRANALASLRELRYFHSPAHGYPGDAACQLPRTSKTPFDHAYFVPLGDGLSGEGFDRGVQSVSDYLYRGTLTPARRFLEACRNTEDASDAQARGTFLRSFGVSAVGPASDAVADGASDRLCRAALRKVWAGSDAAAGSAFDVQNRADTLLGELKLQSEQLQARAARLLGGEPGQQVNQLLQERIAALVAAAPPGTAAARTILQSIAEDFRMSAPAGETAAISESLQCVRGKLAVSMREALTTIRARTLTDSGSSEAGLSGAIHLTRELAQRADRLAAEMAGVVARLESEQAAWAERCERQSNSALSGPEATLASPQTSPPYFEYGMLAICTCMHAAVAESIRGLRTELAGWEQTLTVARERLRSLEALFDVPAGEPSPGAPDAADGSAAVSGPVAVQHLQASVAALSGTTDPGRLEDFVKTPPEALRGLAERISRDAASLLLRGGQRDETPNGLQESRLRPDDTAWPFPTKLGGGHRVLAVTPVESLVAEWRRHLERDFGPCITLEFSPEAEPFLCCELQQLDDQQVEAHLTGDDERIAEMASHLQTRVDVAWHSG